MKSASLVTDGTRPAVRLARQLLDPPSVVWQALTDRKQLRSWFPCDLVVAGERWEVGAALTFVFPAEVIDLTLSGEVLVVDEPNTLAFTWGEELLRFELSANDGGTTLVLIDELAAGIAARSAAGWDVCLDRLAGRSPDQDAWQPLFASYAPAFEPTLGPEEGPPEGYQGD
ncbi:MAG: hypothetical protein QOF30_430 [Acidimicrobiaceae bacterium]|jgi:uncharacterized protein YndB with AHSA1/START domain|nr:hypothetical protein [Acidimicrobiaceae bacterium]